MSIDVKVLKDMIKALNAATYKNDEGEDVSFLETPIKITIGTSADKLAIAFAAAVNSIDDEITGQLPDEVIDFYNDTDFPTEEESQSSEKEEEEPVTKKTPAAKAAPAKKEAPKKEAEKAPAKKEAVKEAPKKTTKKKEPAQLSVFGHKMNTQASKLDALLAPGKSISLADLVKGSGRSELGVKSHIKHLIESRNLTINEKDGVYRYVKNASK
jgi:hypothetical protein